MGIELVILTGHPEHDILFIATQVARAAGLKNPSVSACNFRASKACTMSLRLGDIATHTNYVGSLPASPNGSAFKATTHVMDEATTYQMLLRGHAPASEPFRKWVTDREKRYQSPQRRPSGLQQNCRPPEGPEREALHEAFGM